MVILGVLFRPAGSQETWDGWWLSSQSISWKKRAAVRVANRRHDVHDVQEIRLFFNLNEYEHSPFSYKGTEDSILFALSGQKVLW